MGTIHCVQERDEAYIFTSFAGVASCFQAQGLRVGKGIIAESKDLAYAT